MGLVPLGDRVIVRGLDAEDVTSSGIVIPDMNRLGRMVSDIQEA